MCHICQVRHANPKTVIVTQCTLGIGVPVGEVVACSAICRQRPACALLK